MNGELLKVDFKEVGKGHQFKKGFVTKLDRLRLIELSAEDPNKPIETRVSSIMIYGPIQGVKLIQALGETYEGIVFRNFTVDNYFDNPLSEEEVREVMAEGQWYIPRKRNERIF